MPWFKVDDKLHDHRKARAAGTAAMGVWLLAGSWAADNLTDGFIPAAILPRWGRPRDAKRLVEVGLWHPDEQDGEAGWRFHEWTERQPSREQKLAERAIKAEAGRLGGKASGRSRREANAKHGASSSGPNNAEFGASLAAAGRENGKIPPATSQAGAEDGPGQTVQPQVSTGDGEAQTKQGASSQVEPPTRPDPNPITAGADKPPAARKRATTAPPNFEPNDTNRRLAEEHRVDLDRVLAQFLDHHRAKGSRFVDWHLALNTWIRREKPTQQADLPRRIPHASEIELPPDGLSPREYAEWHQRQRARRHA